MACSNLTKCPDLVLNGVCHKGTRSCRRAHLNHLIPPISAKLAWCALSLMANKQRLNSPNPDLMNPGPDSEDVSDGINKGERRKA